MKVVKTQKNSKNCIICGMENVLGVKAPFYEMEDGRLATIFKFQSVHQSYPGRVHGGMITAMLDELAGRVLWIKQPDIYAVTTSLEVKFYKPVPYDIELKGVGEITIDTNRAYEAKSQIFDMNGSLLASATVKYFKMTKERVSSDSMDDEMIYEINDGVEEIDI